MSLILVSHGPTVSILRAATEDDFALAKQLPYDIADPGGDYDAFIASFECGDQMDEFIRSSEWEVLGGDIVPLAGTLVITTLSIP